MGLFDNIKTKPDEFAKVISWTPKWDAGAPMPQVFSNGLKTYLIYLVDQGVEDLTEIDNTTEILQELALVEFSGHTFRFGIANDEVFSGLTLWKKGLEFYSAHLIENSNWISELKTINKVHPYYKEDKWKDQKHYMLLFHDEILEVIATDYKTETFNTTFGQLALEVAKRMNNK